MGLPPLDQHRRWLAWVLAAVAGFVDCAAFTLLFGLFTAHMSGNTATAAAEVGAGRTIDVLTRITVIGAFTVAIALAFALVEVLGRAGVRRITASALAVEAALLAAFGVVGASLEGSSDFTAGSWRVAVVGCLAAAAMGTQDALLRRVGPVGVHTTFLSGMYMGVGVESARWCFARGGRARRPHDADAARRQADAGAALSVYLPVVILFVVGGIVGAYCAVRIGFSAAAIPLALVVLLIGASTTVDV